MWALDDKSKNVKTSDKERDKSIEMKLLKKQQLIG
jgi:hypothetical protein